MKAYVEPQEIALTEEAAIAVKLTASHVLFFISIHHLLCGAVTSINSSSVFVIKGKIILDAFADSTHSTKLAKLTM